MACIGGPVAQVLTGKYFKITEDRSQWRKGPRGLKIITTLHPGYLIRLRQTDPQAYERSRKLLLDDLCKEAKEAKEII